MARMRTGALRKLHADLGQILADYDASCAEQSAAADEEDDSAASAQTKLAAGHAQDSALREGISMTEAFPTFTHNGPLRRK
jgi:hypothetical protein